MVTIRSATGLYISMIIMPIRDHAVCENLWEEAEATEERLRAALFPAGRPQSADAGHRSGGKIRLAQRGPGLPPAARRRLFCCR
jgi:hypothetical protein